MGMPKVRDGLTVIMEAATRPQITVKGYRDVPYAEVRWSELTVNMTIEQLNDLIAEAEFALMDWNDQEREERNADTLPF